MADSSLVEISYAKESTFGEIPNVDFNRVRHTGGSFGVTIQTTRSSEIRGDAQRSGTVRTGFEPAATLNMELSGQSFDDFIEMVERDSWSTAANVSASDISADSTNDKFVSSSSVDFTTTNIVQGQWVYVDGFSDSSINGWYKAADVGQTTATELVVANSVPADESSGNSITIKGSYIRNGTDKPSMSLQLEHLDLTDKYRRLKGARVGQWSLDLAREIVTGSFQLTAQDHALATSAAGSGTVLDAPDTEVLNGIDHVTGFFIDDTLVTDCVTQFSMQANQNPRRINCIGDLKAADIGLGSLDLTGSITFILDDNTWSQLQDYIDFTKFGLAIAFYDGNGNGYVMEMPKVVRTNEPGNVPGNDEDVTLQFDFSAEPGSIGSETKTLQVSRVS